MTGSTPRRPADPLWITVLGALVAALVVVVNSDLGKGVRYGIGGLLVLVLLGLVFRCSRSRAAGRLPKRR